MNYGSVARIVVPVATTKGIHKGCHKRRRREAVGHVLAQLRHDRLHRPQVLVAAPLSVVNQTWTDLPPGVLLEIGRITLSFDQPQQAFEKLLALATAIGNDFANFERQITASSHT